MIWQLDLSTPAHYVGTHSIAEGNADYAKDLSEGIRPFDANDWIAQLDAILHLDVGHGASLEAAAERVKAKVLVVSSAQDQMVNPQPALDFARLIGAKTLVLEGDCGHLAPGCESAQLAPAVRAFLDGQ